MSAELETPSGLPNPKESYFNFTLRFATEADIESLIPMVNEAYRYENIGDMAFKKSESLRIDPQSFQEIIENDAIFVAVNANKQIIGCFQYKEIPASLVSGSTQDTNAYFGLLTVDPNLQRQGFGKKLVKSAEIIARARGRRVMEIQIVEHSSNLLDFFDKLGYKKFGMKDWSAPFLTKPTQFVLMSKTLD